MNLRTKTASSQPTSHSLHYELVGVGEVWASLINYEEKESGDIMIPGEVGLAVF